MENNTNASSKQLEAVRRGITTSINSSNDKVIGAVIKALSEPIIEKRRDLMLKGLEEVEKLEKELENVKPDIIEYPADKETGKPEGIQMPARYSVGLVKQIEEKRKKIAEIHQAFTAAIPAEKARIPDYSKLEKLYGKSKS